MSLVPYVNRDTADLEPAITPTFTFLTKDSIANGDYEMIGDYSGAVQEFGHVVTVPTLITGFAVRLAGSGSFDLNTYGGMPALSNGIDVTIQTKGIQGGPVVNPVFNNWDWLVQGNEGGSADFPGNSNALSVGFQFSYLRQNGFVLDPTFNDFFKVELNDNFTGLTHHSIVLFTGVFF